MFRLDYLSAIYDTSHARHGRIGMHYRMVSSVSVQEKYLFASDRLVLISAHEFGMSSAGRLIDN